MAKKITTIILVLVAVAAIFMAYNIFFGPETTEGVKDITIEIIVAHEDIDASFSYQTEEELLIDLLNWHQEELGAQFQSFDFGTMVIGMMNYTANESNNEFFHISINGEEAMTGPDEIPLRDHDVYTFELTRW